MNTIIRYCKRESQCGYCPELIHSGDAILETIQWGNKGGSTQRWVYKRRYHPQCWIDKQIQDLKKNPYVGRVGRTPLSISDQDKEKRTSIMMRRASVIQRIRREMEKSDDKRSYDRIIHLGTMLESLKEEILSLGGVPDKW